MLGVIVKTPAANNKQYIALVLTTDIGLPEQIPAHPPNKLQGRGEDFPQGYYIPPKGKRGMDDDYFMSTSRKGSGAVNIKLPHRGNAAGVHYEVIGVEHKDFMSICDCNIKIDQVHLLEDPSNAAYSKTVQQLLEQKTDGRKYPPPLDPVKGINFR